MLGKLLGKLLCIFGFHEKIECSIDGGPYAYKSYWQECKRPGCKWRTQAQNR